MRRGNRVTVADALAQLEGVRACAGGYVARCPVHDDREASLSLREGENGELLMHCFVGCGFDSILTELKLPPLGRGQVDHSLANPSAALDSAKRTELALRIWRQTRGATGTMVETYLRSRGITTVPPALRYHPALKHPYARATPPAMVAGVQNIKGAFVAIHRTWLASDGNGKAKLEPNRAALGPVVGGAVRFARASETLALAEGIETALSVQQAAGIPTWAALGTANLTRVELPACVGEVFICADHDVTGAGEKAALAAAAKFMREGRKTRIALPPGVGADFNDLLRT
jgi:putative DNA primase/helicase